MKINHSLLLIVLFLGFTQQGCGMERLSKALNNFADRIKEQERLQQAAYRESYLRHGQITHKAPQKKFDPIAEKRIVETIDMQCELNFKQ